MRVDGRASKGRGAPRSRRYPPGPRSSPYVNLVRYARDPLAFLTALAREYGDIARFSLPSGDYVLLNDPDLTKDVLVTNHRCFVKGRFYEELKRLLGEGLLTSEGDSHHTQRRLLQPLFRQECVTAYGGVMVDAAARTRDRWRDGAELDVSEEMMRLTLAVVAMALLDADVESEAREVGEAVDAGMVAFDRFLLPFSHVLWKLPLPATRRFLGARERLDALIYSLIADRRREAGERPDLLSHLVRVQTEGGEIGMSERQVRDEVMTILLAGHETTAQALTWTWYLLARHPEIEAALEDELDDVLAGEPPSVADLSRLSYTRMLLAESMRLFPPSWMVTRRALVDHELGGHVVPAGSIIFISQFVTHRDDRYFPNPLRFAPERWADAAEPERKKFVYFPFGAGPRLCIGERFAWMEAILLLATLAERWRLRLVPGQRVVPKPMVTLRPRYGLRMTATARHPMS
ncbi:MAG: cytochrome P450 [Actinomycetota bacterium]|nr:cytochrome P450 [Actinomycetota bacterium]